MTKSLFGSSLRSTASQTLGMLFDLFSPAVSVLESDILPRVISVNQYTEYFEHFEQTLREEIAKFDRSPQIHATASPS